MGVRHYFTCSDDLRSYPTVLAFLQDRPTQAIVVRNAPLLGYGTTEGAWYSRMIS